MRGVKGKRDRTLLTLLTAAIMVASVGAMIAPASAAATALAAGSSPAASPAAPAIPSGPLTQVVGPSNLNPDESTQFGQITVNPASSSYRSSAPMEVTVNLAPSSSFSSYVASISDPGSPNYRSYLTAAEIGQYFGPSVTHYQLVSSYFAGYGLTVTSSPTMLELTLSGTVAQFSSAFHTSFGAFQESYLSSGTWNPAFGPGSATAGSTTTGPVFYSNLAAAELPASVQKMISGVSGLDGLYAVPDLTLPHGLSPSTTATSGSVATDGAPTSMGGHFSPTLNASDIQAIDGANYTWANLTPTFYCQYENLCGNYQFLWPSTMHVVTGAEALWDGSAAIGGKADKGQGITIALVEVGCVFPSDMAAFSQMVWGNPNQLPDRLTQIALQGPTAIVPNNNLNNCTLNGEFYGWNFEASLDVEYAATMAPLAHIDVIGVPSADYSAFDSSYLTIATYLATGKTCNLAGSNATIVDGTATNACSVSIDSNSYGSGEQTQYFFGAPMYINVEDQDLQILNAVGVTNLFSSGDYGASDVAASASIPAVSPGSTSVGGGQLTVAGKSGLEFPAGRSFCFGYYDPTIQECSEFNMTVVHASSLASFTYWSYGEGLTGTYQGVVGGGFGSSVAEPQPWWQNGLDTFSTGTMISPVVSGSADFNMSAYYYGSWYTFYGGTSFSCPITTGELALIEEQANLATGSPKLGDVNPLLYAAHNAFEAGVSYASTNPYVPMTNIGVGLIYAPTNYWSWYYWNLSINEPSDPLLPGWFTTLSNPAGPGWNFLQGLGMPNAAVLSNILVESRSGVPGILLPSFVVQEETPSGLSAVTTLNGGTSYSFEVIGIDGSTGGSYTVQAYSGGTNTGTWGGGTVSTISVPSGTYSYTPTYATPFFPSAATEYGYFVITNSSDPAQVTFQAFAVAAPPATGSLKLCVTNPYGVCATGTVETTMFTTVQTGYYNLYGSATVELNGLPVLNALVSQQVLLSQFGLIDPTMPPSSYAPGTIIGHTLSDARGNDLFWTAPLGLAEIQGELLTQVYVLQASYEGLFSNKVIVFVEPQSGSFFPDLKVTDGGTMVTGILQFSDTKYVNWINVTDGSGPGEYQNTSFPAGTTNGEISVSIATPAHGPVVVGITAEGQNNVTFTECFTEEGITYCYTSGAAQNPIYWQYAEVLARGS